MTNFDHSMYSSISYPDPSVMSIDHQHELAEAPDTGEFLPAKIELARDFRTAPTALMMLLETGNEDLVLSAASNPALPTDSMRELLCVALWDELSQELAMNPALPSWVIEAAYEEGLENYSRTAVYLLANHSNCPEWVADAMRDYLTNR